MSIRLNSARRVITKSGKVSCECCGNVIPCPSDYESALIFGNNFEFATFIPITRAERQSYLTNGITILQEFSASPFTIEATRNDGTKHEISGGTVAATFTGSSSTPLCRIVATSYLTWQVTDLFKPAGYSQRLNTFTASNSLPFYCQIRFLDDYPNHLLFGFFYTHGMWDLALPLFYPYNLLYVIEGTTQEIDKSQFLVGYSSFAPGFTDFILAPTQFDDLPSGSNFSVTSGVTVNGISVPINDPPRYFFKHVPSENSIVPQGTYTINSLSHQINLAVTIAPLTSPP